MTARHINIIILPRTAAGRDLLRLILPDVDWATGRLPDDSSIYGCNWDEAAVDAQQSAADYEVWYKAHGRDF